MALIPRNVVKMRINDIETGKNRRMTIVKVQIKVMLRPTASLSWFQAPCGAQDQIFTVETLAGLFMWGAISEKRRGVSFATDG
jgi:hypothetical protein